MNRYNSPRYITILITANNRLDKGKYISSHNEAFSNLLLSPRLEKERELFIFLLHFLSTEKHSRPIFYCFV